MSRPAPPTIGSPPGGGKGAAKFKRQVSPETRQKMSEATKKRHQESDGRGFGQGLTKPGNKPRRRQSKARVAQLVAEAARDEKNAAEIIDVFRDGIHSSQPIHIRLKAAEAWIKVETDDAKFRLKEDETESVQRDRNELLQLLAGKFTDGPTAGLLRRQLAEQSESDPDIIDVDPEDVEEFE